MEFRLASAAPLFASSEQIDELAQHADAAEGGDEDALARAPLEDERLVAVDPLALAAADLDGRELVDRIRNPSGALPPCRTSSSSPSWSLPLATGSSPARQTTA